MTDEATQLTQTDEQRRAVLAGSATGKGTASGQEKARLGDSPPEIPTGEDRGADVSKIANHDEIVADGAGNDSQKPIGAQAEPANFVSNGSLPIGMVGSPGGPVPAATPEEAAAAAKTIPGRALTHEGFQRIPRSQIEQASGAMLRAAAYDRGWDIGGDAGSRVTRSRFIQKQNEMLGPDEPTATDGS